MAFLNVFRKKIILLASYKNILMNLNEWKGHLRISCTGFCSDSASVHQMFTLHSIKQMFLNTKTLCVCLWTRRHAPCCWRRVCTIFRPNSSAALQTKRPRPITAASHPFTCIPPHLHLPPPPPGSPPPSWCIGLAWLLMDALWPTPSIKVWKISSWLWHEAVVQCSAAAPRRCRRAW